jgi:hypothetical protein
MIDAIAAIQRRVKTVRFIVPPTVLQELAMSVMRGERVNKRKVAPLRIMALWNFEPVNFVPIGHGIVEPVGRALRERYLLRVPERNDASVLAEAALLGCLMLLTGNAHLRGIVSQRLTLLLRCFDVTAPVIPPPCARDRVGVLPLNSKSLPRHSRQSIPHPHYGYKTGSRAGLSATCVRLTRMHLPDFQVLDGLNVISVN